MGGGGGGGVGEWKLLPQTLFLPPQNKYHIATPFPVLKSRPPPKIMRARRGLLIQRMRESEPTPFSETFTSEWLKTSLYVRMLCILIVVYAVLVLKILLTSPTKLKV